MRDTSGGNVVLLARQRTACGQRTTARWDEVRACFHLDTHAAGRCLAETVLTSLPSCPIPEVARLGRTLKQRREAFLGYFDTYGASNGGTEAVNGLIELHRCIARDFRNRDNYRPDFCHFVSCRCGSLLSEC